MTTTGCENDDMYEFDLLDPLMLSSHEFDAFRDLIYRYSGIQISATKKILLSNRIRVRLKAGGFDGFQAYLDLLTSAQDLTELENFLDVVTTNETLFFRAEKHFEWFRTDFLQHLTTGDRESKRLRVWSAACSTGEEPYSLAICLLENQARLSD